MNPKITITVDAKNKAIATITGMATVGAKVDVEVVGLPSDIPNWKAEDPYNGKSVRFRVVTDAGQDLVRFPMVEKTGPNDGDKWTVVPAVGTTTPETYKTNDGTNTTPEVDFNTDVMRKAFRGVPYNETLEFGLILDSSVDAAQYAVGKIKIRQWAADSQSNPTVLPDWKGTVKSIVGTTLKDETMENIPTQKQMTMALKTIWQKLGGTFTVWLLALCAFGEVTRGTEWWEIPPQTPVSNVVDLAQGVAGVTPAVVTNIANARIGAEVAPWARTGQPQPTTDLTGMTNLVRGVAQAGTNYTDTVAATKAPAVEGGYLPKSGGTVVGDLVITGNVDIVQKIDASPFDDYSKTSFWWYGVTLPIDGVLSFPHETDDSYIQEASISYDNIERAFMFVDERYITPDISTLQPDGTPIMTAGSSDYAIVDVIYDPFPSYSNTFFVSSGQILDITIPETTNFRITNVVTFSESRSGDCMAWVHGHVYDCEVIFSCGSLTPHGDDGYQTAKANKKTLFMVSKISANDFIVVKKEFD